MVGVKEWSTPRPFYSASRACLNKVQSVSSIDYCEVARTNLANVKARWFLTTDGPVVSRLENTHTLLIVTRALGLLTECFKITDLKNA